MRAARLTTRSIPTVASSAQCRSSTTRNTGARSLSRTSVCARRVAQPRSFGIGRYRLGLTDLGQRFADCGHQAGDDRGVVSEHRLDPVRVTGAHPLSECLGERRVGDDVAVVATTHEHDGARGLGLACNLGHEPRLADAGLTRDQRQPTGSVGGASPRGLQRLALTVAADVRSRGAQVGGDLAYRVPAQRPNIEWFGQPFQLERPHAGELEVGSPTRQQPHHVREIDRTGRRRRAEPRGLDDRRAEAVTLFERDVTGRHTDTHGQRRALAPAVGVQRLLHRDRGRERLGRAGERDQQPVAETLDHAAAVRVGLLAEQRVVRAAQLVGARLADLSAQTRRVGQIGDDDRRGARIGHGRRRTARSSTAPSRVVAAHRSSWPPTAGRPALCPHRR